MFHFDVYAVSTNETGVPTGTIISDFEGWCEKFGLTEIGGDDDHALVRAENGEEFTIEFHR